MRNALTHFFQVTQVTQRSYSSYSALVIARHDVRLLSPVTSWLCDLNARVNVAAKCEQAAWRRYRCVNDLMFTVPRGRLAAFNASIGSHLGASTRKADGQCGCFVRGACPGRPTLPHRSHLITGHDCYNVLERHVADATPAGGAGAQIGFCWPQVARRVRDANAYYALPQCADVDRDAPYAKRACLLTARLASLSGKMKMVKDG